MSRAEGVDEAHAFMKMLFDDHTPQLNLKSSFRYGTRFDYRTDEHGPAAQRV